MYVVSGFLPEEHTQSGLDSSGGRDVGRVAGTLSV
jgi:hypothetical protein